MLLDIRYPQRCIVYICILDIYVYITPSLTTSNKELGLKKKEGRPKAELKFWHMFYATLQDDHIPSSSPTVEASHFGT